MGPTVGPKKKIFLCCQCVGGNIPCRSAPLELLSPGYRASIQMKHCTFIEVSLQSRFKEECEILFPIICVGNQQFAFCHNLCLTHLYGKILQMVFVFFSTNWNKSYPYFSQRILSKRSALHHPNSLSPAPSPEQVSIKEKNKALIFDYFEILT